MLVIDAVEGLTAQDAHVAGYVVEEGKGLVIAVNKWDIVEDKTDRTFDQYVEWIRSEVPFLDFAPIVSISAKTGPARRARARARHRHLGRAPEADPDRRAEPGPPARVERQQPPVVRAAARRSSTARRPPSRRRHSCSSPTTRRSIHFSYRRYLENQLRDAFGFDGTPIKLVFRDRESATRCRGAARRAGRR